MVKCHKCGHSNDEGHEFCEECGAKLKAELKCKKCGHRLKPDDDFCEECGAKLKESKAPHHEHKTESKLAKYKWWLIGAGIFVFLGVIFVFAVPLPYEAKESYTEKVPYEDQETYIVNEPYTEKECPLVRLLYQAERTDVGYSGLCTSDKLWSDNKCRITSTITIENTNPDNGQFGLICKYSDGTTSSWGLSALEDNYISAWSKKDFPCTKEYEFGTTLFLMEFEVQPPLKNNPDCSLVTKNRNVQKTRTITKYKDEYKERFATKYATLFQQWSGQAKYYYKVE